MKKIWIWIVIVLVITALVIYYVMRQRELSDEYKIYQKAYMALEKFHSGGHPPEFVPEIKQVIIPQTAHSPELVDRCMSCHVAVKLPYFSPTRIAYDINGEMEINALGKPRLEPNPSYIFTKLDKFIEELREEDEEKHAKKIAYFEGLKTIEVRGKKIKLKNVLSMHPLIGREMAPFEYHPVEEYGCSKCHAGNESSLIADEAHGPVSDGQYEVASDSTPSPPFIEKDPVNDPCFANIFNAKPVSTDTPILAGPLLQSTCVACHQGTQSALNHTADAVNRLVKNKSNQVETIENGIKRNKQALVSLLKLIDSIKTKGCTATVEMLKAATKDPKYTAEEVEHFKQQFNYIQAFQVNLIRRIIEEKDQPPYMIHKLCLEVADILGSKKLMRELGDVALGKPNVEELVEKFLKEHPGPEIKRTIFGKELALRFIKQARDEFDKPKQNLSYLASQKSVVRAMATSVDPLIINYKRGQELYMTQGCYSCHRIAGLSRGNTGSDLTTVGLLPPWYVKLSLLWPQGKMKTSTMPTFGFDVVQAQDLMTFLLAQKGPGYSQFISPMGEKLALKEWEGGEKMPWEKPIIPTELLDQDFARTVFATEGCASCHKLTGFTGNVDIKSEDKEWFTRLFPEQITGRGLVEALEKNGAEIDKRILEGVRKDTILQKIEESHPGVIESFYANFAFANRAKKEDEWRKRLHRVLVVYIQQYGLGRAVGPYLNCAGVYRSIEWLMGHFKSPQDYSPRSIMPTFPFDESKFYSLALMLQAVGKENCRVIKKQWNEEGFNPAEAYALYCSQCHGENRRGNGSVAALMYPIPKSLRDTTFLINLTKERAIYSLIHGVKGTPMPPWGEIAEGGTEPVLTVSQIKQLADWLYQDLPDYGLIASNLLAPKWHYTPLDELLEMQREKGMSENPQGLVAEYFTEKPNPDPTLDKKLYYIREKYYTPDNIAKGEAFFLGNCATCHGSEATGTGPRADYMVNAKPRMLTNVAWIESKDDLRLLCSIKFGVAGTSMTPWGDQTSAEQRLQLVMYIRTLSEEKILRETLSDLLYKDFTNAFLMIEEFRAKEYVPLATVQSEYDAVYEKLDVGHMTPELSGQDYALAVTDYRKSKALQERDAILVGLEQDIKDERDHYQTIGTSLIDKKIGKEIIEAFNDILKAHGSIFAKVEDKITCLDDPAREAMIEAKVQIFYKKMEAHADDRAKVMTELAIAKQIRQKQCNTWKSYHDTGS